MFKDGGRDWPGSVRRRICSGKGPEEFSYAELVRARLDAVGEVFLFHQPGDLLLDGTDVMSNCASSQSDVGGGEPSLVELASEDLEIIGGPFDPNESDVDSVAVAELGPTGPGRGLVSAGACNH